MVEPGRYATFERNEAMGEVREEPVGFEPLNFAVLDGNSMEIYYR